MGDVKQIRRLQTAAAFEYADGGSSTPTVVLSEHKDGGPYDLHPLIQTDGSSSTLLLPSPQAPGYAVALRFEDPDTALRVGRAILGLANRGGKEAAEE